MASLHDIKNLCGSYGVKIDKDKVLRTAYHNALIAKYGEISCPEENDLYNNRLDVYLAIKQVQKIATVDEWKTWKKEIDSVDASTKHKKLTRLVIDGYLSKKHSSEYYDAIENHSDNFSSFFALAPSFTTLLAPFRHAAAAIMLKKGKRVVFGRELTNMKSLLFLSKFVTSWDGAQSIVSKNSKLTVDQLLSEQLYIVALALVVLQGADTTRIIETVMMKEELTGWLKRVGVPSDVKIAIPELTESEQRVKHCSIDSWREFRSVVDKYKDSRSATTQAACGKLDVWALVLTELEAMSGDETDVELYSAILKFGSLEEHNRRFAQWIDRYPTMVELLRLKNNHCVDLILRGLGKVDMRLPASDWRCVASLVAAERYVTAYKEQTRSIECDYRNKANDPSWPFYYPYTAITASYLLPLKAELLYRLFSLEGSNAIDFILSRRQDHDSRFLEQQLIYCYGKTLDCSNGKNQENLSVQAVVLKIVEILAFPYDKWVKDLVNELMRSFPLPRDNAQFLEALNRFLQAFVDGKKLVDNIPATIELLHKLIVVSLFDYLGNSYRAIITLLIRPEWKFKFNRIQSLVDKQDVQLFMIVYKSISDADVDPLYDYVFNNSPTILALMLSENALKMTRVPLLTDLLTEKQMISLHILLRHPNTDPVLCNDPILKSYLSNEIVDYKATYNNK